MLKKGKEEIIYLLNKCIEKYEQENGTVLTKNTNRKNYEPLALQLSEISNNLPETSAKFGHQEYEGDTENKEKEYPFRKYDITGGQVRDALMGLVANPRSFLIDTCYIYLYSVGRKAFEQNPLDPELLSEETANLPANSYSLLQDNQRLKTALSHAQKKTTEQRKKTVVLSLIGSLVVVIAFSIILFQHQKQQSIINELKSDFSITPYAIGKAEKNAIEGIWLCYTGSPQARLSDSDRAKKVVLNIAAFKEKNGYFTYKRYGASFNHLGYAQFENNNTVSIHSRLLTLDNKVLSPRHSLLQLDSTRQYLNVISASWNFDVGEKNRVIGIREVYKKIGEGGELEEILNSVENAECKCKIIRWKKPGGEVEEFRLKNSLLDSIKPVTLQLLLNEKSILVKDLEDTLLIKHPR